MVNAIFFTGYILGLIVMTAPDMSKAKQAAANILALLKRESRIDASDSEGKTIVCVNFGMWNL